MHSKSCSEWPATPFRKRPRPPLVELTRPRFYDGDVATLDEAIDVMARYRLERSIPTAGRKENAAHLRSLRGDRRLLQS